jgi:hypothetical protein
MYQKKRHANNEQTRFDNQNPEENTVNKEKIIEGKEHPPRFHRKNFFRANGSYRR